MQRWHVLIWFGAECSVLYNDFWKVGGSNLRPTLPPSTWLSYDINIAYFDMVSLMLDMVGYISYDIFTI